MCMCIYIYIYNNSLSLSIYIYIYTQKRGMFLCGRTSFLQTSCLMQGRRVMYLKRETVHGEKRFPTVQIFDFAMIFHDFAMTNEFVKPAVLSSAAYFALHLSLQGEHPFGFSILTAERTYELFTHSYQARAHS